jgi:hypothetical protein
VASFWQLSVVFPATVFQPFIDTVSTLIPHLTAIIVADMMRRHAIDTGTWFKAYGARQRANSANYIRVALVCGVAGYVALISWGLTQASPSLDGFKIEVSNALLAIATGWFYVYHLDNVELDQRPSRVWELGSQTIVTGFGGFIAACATWQIIEIPGGVPVDKIVLTTLINASVGFVFAWYIPRAAAAARPDPLVEAKEERIRALEAAALARFNSPAQATAWLEQPHPVLGKSPKAAAADVDGYEHAISLLQGPPSLVA